MKNNLLFLLLLISGSNIFSQSIITQWNFNNITAGTISTATPSTGSGSTITLLNGVTTPTSGSGGCNSNVCSSDTEPSATNKALQTTTYPDSGIGNKQSGIEFGVSTVGYKNISLSFDQRLSNTSSCTWIVQYSTDGTNFTDGATLTFTPDETTGDQWYNNRTIDLSTFTALNNNPAVKFRIVAAFYPSTEDYLAANSTKTYSSAGTSRFDMITINGTSTLGVDDVYLKDKIKIYPNPATDYIYFSQQTKGKIIDLNGRSFLSFDAESLNISNLKNGIYLVIFEDNSSEKIIKK